MKKIIPGMLVRLKRENHDDFIDGRLTDWYGISWSSCCIMNEDDVGLVIALQKDVQYPGNKLIDEICVMCNAGIGWNLVNHFEKAK